MPRGRPLVPLTRKRDYATCDLRVGLTWAELGQLLGASPQSIHSWASGGTLDVVTEHRAGFDQQPEAIVGPVQADAEPRARPCRRQQRHLELSPACIESHEGDTLVAGPARR